MSPPHRPCSPTDAHWSRQAIRRSAASDSQCQSCGLCRSSALTSGTSFSRPLNVSGSTFYAHGLSSCCTRQLKREATSRQSPAQLELDSRQFLPHIAVVYTRRDCWRTRIAIIELFVSTPSVLNFLAACSLGSGIITKEANFGPDDIANRRVGKLRIESRCCIYEAIFNPAK